MKKRQRVLEVAGVLGELVGDEARLRWRRSRNGEIDPEVYEQMRAVTLRRSLERLGPLYIKVGQVLSTRPDIVSQQVIDALQDLHEDVNERPFSEFEPVMVANLGTEWRSRFRQLDTERAIGAASIAQVYRGVLTNGSEVAVKVQRPGVAAAARLDMEILAQAVKLAMKRAPGDGRQRRRGGRPGRPGDGLAHRPLQRSRLPGRHAALHPHPGQRGAEGHGVGTNFNQFLVFCTRRGIAVNPGIALFGKATANLEGSLRRFAPELNTFDVFRDVMGGILRDQAGQLMSQDELLRVANEAFQATHSIPEQVRYLAQSVMNGQYVLRTRDDSAVIHEAREDARARAMRRTLVGIAAAALWLDHRRKRLA